MTRRREAWLLGRFNQELFPNGSRQCGVGAGSLSSRPCLPVHFLPFPQPRDVTNFTVGGFAPMSPRISSPMHPSAGGEGNLGWGYVWGVEERGCSAHTH